MTRWNLSISEKTDRVVRTFLARTGGKKGDLSRFVDESSAPAACWILPFARSRTATTRHDQQEILDLIDEEVDAGRVRVVLDTNILIGALITKGTPPDSLYQAWIRGEIEACNVHCANGRDSRCSRPAPSAKFSRHR